MYAFYTSLTYMYSYTALLLLFKNIPLHEHNMALSVYTALFIYL